MIRFITDSGSDIPQGTPGVQVLPLHISFGEETFLDGVTIDHETFYNRLTSSKTLPITSQATPYHFTEAFEAAVEAGDTVVCVTLSSKLSGTYQSACIAAAPYSGKVFVVDSLSATVGQRILIERGQQLAGEGLSAADIAERLLEERHDILLLGLLDTLEYLKRGGRISAGVAMAANLLSIKPVVTLKDGEVALLGKARGSKLGNNFLIRETQNSGGIDFSRPLVVGYTGNSTELLDRYIADSTFLYEGKIDKLPVMTVGSAIGTHIGPGAIAVAFFTNRRKEIV